MEMDIQGGPTNHINASVQRRLAACRGGATVVKVGGQILTPHFLASGGAQNIAQIAQSA